MDIDKLFGKQKILIRKCREVTVQRKKGFLVEGEIERDLKDAERLKDEGFYIYGVRSNVGIPWTLEDSMVVHNHYGYIVLKEPVLFRQRYGLTDDICPKYFTLNNQYSSISKKYKIVNLMNGSLY